MTEKWSGIVNKNLKGSLKDPKKQCFGSGSVLIRFILVSRIRIRFNETDPDPDPGSKKSVKIMGIFNKNQQKSLEYHTFFSKLINLCLLTYIFTP